MKHLINIINKLKKIVPNLDGIFLCGSRATGNADKNSDWDFVAVLRNGQSFRRTWRDEQGNRVELFSNTYEDLYGLDLRNDIVRNPMLRMIAEGIIVYDPEKRLREIYNKAKAIYKNGLVLSEDSKRYICYKLYNYESDLLSSANSDGQYLRLKAIDDILEYFFKLHGKWFPKPRYVEKEIRRIDRKFYKLYTNAVSKLSSSNGNEQILLLIQHLKKKYTLPWNGEISGMRSTFVK